LIKYNLKIKFYIKKSTASGLDKVVVNVTAVDANGQTVLHYAVAGDPDEPDDVRGWLDCVGHRRQCKVSLMTMTNNRFIFN
jgi:hypothetical protein